MSDEVPSDSKWFRTQDQNRTDPHMAAVSGLAPKRSAQSGTHRLSGLLQSSRAITYVHLSLYMVHIYAHACVYIYVYSTHTYEYVSIHIYIFSLALSLSLSLSCCTANAGCLRYGRMVGYVVAIVKPRFGALSQTTDATNLAGLTSKYNGPLCNCAAESLGGLAAYIS